jgi:hypothetical protein
VNRRLAALALFFLGCAPTVMVRPGGAPVAVRYTGPGQAVHLTGDMTGWQPVPLLRTGDGWELELHLPAGRYEYRLEVRQGSDTVPLLPAGSERVDDGYGGENAVLRVAP